MILTVGASNAQFILGLPVGDTPEVALHDESSDFILHLPVLIHNLCPGKHCENAGQATIGDPDLV